jgi:WD40 repeat protein/serine/threonine protein kinase
MSDAPPEDLPDTLDAPLVAPKVARLAMPPVDSVAGGLTLLASEATVAVIEGGASRLAIVDRGSYEVAAEVGRGGIGRVLRACDTRLNRPVAIKELLGSAGEVAEERFVREALLTARLQHPSIVPLYEAGRWPSGAPFYAMKLVTGRSLEDVIAETRSLPQRLALLPHVLAAAEAMAYAHSEQIIHRDLKPANVLVGAFGETVVIDWGLAKDLALPAAEGDAPIDEAAAAIELSRPLRRSTPGTTPPAEALTLHGAVMGTPAYMPPEQAQGSGVDERADVYALGAILYHLLAGACPYDGDTSGQILRRVLASPPEPLALRQPGIPQDLVTIVTKAMARDRADRYPSARELAEDLRRFQTGQIVGAHSYSRRELLRRFGRRYRAALSVAAAAIGVLTILGVASVRRIMVESSRAREKQASAEEAEHRAVERADDLTLVQARAAVERDPNQAIGWLKTLSPGFQRWPEARLIAADARAHGIATVLRGPLAAVNDVRFSPDGTLVVTTSDDHSVRLWDPASPAASRLLAGHTDEVWCSAFSPDGSVLATGSKDKTIRIWDPKTGASRVLVGHVGPISEVAFASAELLVSGSDDGTARLWDVKTGESRGVLGARGIVRSIAVALDGRTVACAGDDGALRLWDVKTGAVRVLTGHPVSIYGVAFSPDSKTVATRDRDGMVRLWDAATGASRVLAERLGDNVFGLSAFGKLRFSPDGSRLAAAGDGPFVRLWDLVTGAAHRLEGPAGPTSWLAFSRDSALLAVASFDHTARVYDLASDTSRVFHGFDTEVTALAFSPDGKALAAASGDGMVRLFPVVNASSRVIGTATTQLRSLDVSPDQESALAAGADGIVRLWSLRSGALTTLEGHAGRVVDARFSPDGSVIASTGIDKTTRLWDLEGDAIWIVRGGGSGMSPAFSPDGRLVAAAGATGTVQLIDVDSGAMRELRGHTGPIESVAFSRDGARLVSGSHDRTLRIWDVATGESRVLSGHDDAVFTVALSPDGKLVASGGNDHSLRLWDLATGEARRADAGGGGITGITFSADGSSLFTCDLYDASVRRWDAATLAPRPALRGHLGFVRRFALSGDERRLVSASADSTVRVWDPASGESRILRGHTGMVSSVAFTADDRQILSTSVDGTLRIWSDDLPDDPAALRAWIGAATSDR